MTSPAVAGSVTDGPRSPAGDAARGRGGSATRSVSGYSRARGRRGSRSGPAPRRAARRPAASRLASSPVRHRRRRVPEQRPPSRPRTARAPVERRGGADDAGAARHGPLQRVAQLGDVRAGQPVGARSPMTAGAGSTPRCTPMPSMGSRRARPAARRSPRGPCRPTRSARPGGRRTPCPRAASWRPAGWRRARQCRPSRPRPQAGQRGGAPQIGDDAAGEVVRGRRDRQPVVLGVEPDRRTARRRSSGSAGEALEPGGVEPEVVDALLGHACRHGPAHDVAGRQLVDEALAVVVAQHRALAAQRLGEQRPRHRRMVQRGRVELDELDVGRRHAGPQRHRDPVAGRLRRVGRDREELAGPARREHDVAGAHLDLTVAAGRQRDAPRCSARPRPAARSRTTPRARARRASVASTSARSTSAPVAAPPACTTRGRE